MNRPKKSDLILCDDEVFYVISPSEGLVFDIDLGLRRDLGCSLDDARFLHSRPQGDVWELYIYALFFEGDILIAYAGDPLSAQRKADGRVVAVRDGGQFWRVCSACFTRFGFEAGEFLEPIFCRHCYDQSAACIPF